jgi:hypothetical protein
MLDTCTSLAVVARFRTGGARYFGLVRDLGLRRQVPSLAVEVSSLFSTE